MEDQMQFVQDSLLLKTYKAVKGYNQYTVYKETFMYL